MWVFICGFVTKLDFEDLVTLTLDTAFNLFQTANTYLPDPLITVTDSDTGDTKHCTMNCPPEGQGRFTMERDTCLVYFTTDYSTDFGDPSVVVCDVTVTDSTGNISSTTSPLTITISMYLSDFFFFFSNFDIIRDGT